jgi:predicted transcriptional regulator
MDMFRAVVALVAAGKTIAEIAAVLGVSEAWVAAIAGTDAAGAGR